MAASNKSKGHSRVLAQMVCHGKKATMAMRWRFECGCFCQYENERGLESIFCPPIPQGAPLLPVRFPTTLSPRQCMEYENQSFWEPQKFIICYGKIQRAAWRGASCIWSRSLHIYSCRKTSIPHPRESREVLSKHNTQFIAKFVEARIISPFEHFISVSHTDQDTDRNG